MKSDFYVVWMK